MLYKIYPLTLARFEVDKSIMTYRVSIGKKVWTPIISWYVKGGDKNILVDTGGCCKMINKYLSGNCEDIMSFEEALAQHDLTPDKIDIVIQTHLHHDHSINTRKCINAKIIVQERELNFAYAPHPIQSNSYDKALLEDLRFIVVNGDHRVAEGIEVLFTPGHTPGGQSVAIETSKGKAIITGFCCIMENFEPAEEMKKRLPVIPLGIALNPVDGYNSLIKVKGLADILLPVHEPKICEMESIP